MEFTNNRRRKTIARGVTVAAVGGLGVSLLGVLGATSASADPVKKDYKFTCVYPLIGKQPTPVTVETDIPSKIAVGEQTPPIKVKATAYLGPKVTDGLISVRASTIEGTATSELLLKVPEEEPNGLSVWTDVVMAPVAVPKKGQGFEVVTEGEAPQLTFSKAGKGQIFLTGLTQHIDPKKADGTSVWPAGKDVACTLDAGQTDPLWEFEITEGAASTS